ncbi:angiopoietin-1-like [Salminus brasiliensis]|uniref:angiopoietin-1-like n=1 Tax=Salminus brasiliensis TaxID=930266 RepID=UPI003B83914E
MTSTGLRYFSITLLLTRTFSIENPSIDGSSDNLASRSSHSGLLTFTQHGQCSYTYLLPEPGGCWSPENDREYEGNTVQRDAPLVKQSLSYQRIQHLEVAVDNYTHWLKRIEGYVKDGLKEMTQLQHITVPNHTAAMLDLGSSLLYQTVHYTRRLTDMETQVINQTSRLEIQLLENSLSTAKLETELLRQTSEINKLYNSNKVLEQRMQDMEARHSAELGWAAAEQAGLQKLITTQTSIIQSLELSLEEANSNNSALYSQQIELHDTVSNLLKLCASQKASTSLMKQADEQRTFRDCAELFQAGFNKSGIYAIHIPLQDNKKVYCNMETAGGGWTVIQLRKDGALDFHRTWKEYKMGFGSLSEEHWLGNEFVFQLTSQRQYTLRVELTDWKGQQVFSQFDSFQIASEKHNYRLFLKGHSGTAGRQSSLVINGADFSTKDMDNDNCICNCALLLTGGWWFDACGPSNLNGMYYSYGQNTGKFNGIKWHYFKGSSYSLRATAMMIRPVDF